jgi:hypothetical protein
LFDGDIESIRDATEMIASIYPKETKDFMEHLVWVIDETPGLELITLNHAQGIPFDIFVRAENLDYSNLPGFGPYLGKTSPKSVQFFEKEDYSSHPLVQVVQTLVKNGLYREEGQDAKVYLPNAITLNTGTISGNYAVSGRETLGTKYVVAAFIDFTVNILPTTSRNSHHITEIMGVLEEGIREKGYATFDSKQQKKNFKELLRMSSDASFSNGSAVKKMHDILGYSQHWNDSIHINGGSGYVNLNKVSPIVYSIRKIRRNV